MVSLAAAAAMSMSMLMSACGSKSGGGTAGSGGAGTGSGGTTGTGGVAAGSGGGTGSGGSSGAGGAAPTTDGGLLTDDLGKACTANAECGGGLICLKATDKVIFGAGGPPNGYCSSPCVHGDGKCQMVGGVCADLRVSPTDADQSYCLRSCTFASTDRATKCHGRADVGCAVHTASTGEAYCMPVCSQDSHCPTGRVCNLATGVCVDSAPAGDPLGAHCGTDPDGGVDNCAGVCLGVGATATHCSMRCVLGEDGCNTAGKGVALTGTGHGLCVLAPSKAKAGDLGYCSQQCDTTEDCLDKVDPAVCDQSPQSVIGHGACNYFGTGSATDGGTGG